MFNLETALELARSGATLSVDARDLATPALARQLLAAIQKANGQLVIRNADTFDPLSLAALAREGGLDLTLEL